MIKHISSPTISEEILGAYLEGNLSEYETQRVEHILECDDDLDALVDEIAVENLTMLDTNADSWATLPEILIQLVAIASVTQEPYFEKHC